MYELVIYGVMGLMIAWLMKKQHIDTRIVNCVYVLIAGIFLVRFSIGPDSGVYAQVFNRVEHPFQEMMTSHMQRNILYTLLSYSCKKLFHEYRWLVFVQNILILGGCTWVIWKYSKNRLLSLLLFIGSGMLEVFYGSGVRQALAMTVYLFAFYEFLPKKQILLYELFCLISFGFQEIGLLVMVLPALLPLVPVFRKKPVHVIAVCLAVSLILFWFVKAYVCDLSYRILEMYGTAPVWTHVIAYLRFQEFSILGFGMESVFGIGILIMYYFADRDKLSDFTLFSLLVFLFSVFFYLSFSSYDLVSRISDFIQIIILVLIPELLDAIPDMKKKAVSYAGVFLLNGVLLYADINANLRRISEQFERQYSLNTYPYVCVFDKPAVDAYQVYLDRV